MPAQQIPGGIAPVKNMRFSNTTPRRLGVSLVEIVVVIAVLAILMALLVVAMVRVRERANLTKCQDNFKRVAQAAHRYQEINGAFPAGTLNPYCRDDSTRDDNRTWFHFLLPYVDQMKLYDALETFRRNGEPMGFLYTGSLAPYVQTIVPVYVCPSDPRQPKTLTYPSHGQQGFHGNIAGCAGSTSYNATECSGNALDGIFYWKSAIEPQDIVDGASNTLFFGEIVVSDDVTTSDTRGRYWNNAFQGSIIFSTLYPPNTSVPDRLQWCQSIPTAPCTTANTYIVQSARSYHERGVNASMADGSVRFLGNDVSPDVYRALGTRAGLEATSLE